MHAETRTEGRPYRRSRLHERINHYRSTPSTKPGAIHFYHTIGAALLTVALGESVAWTVLLSHESDLRHPSYDTCNDLKNNLVGLSFGAALRAQGYGGLLDAFFSPEVSARLADQVSTWISQGGGSWSKPQGA